MNEQNLPDLRQEIATLQKVLRNVIEQNEALKAENSVLRALIKANSSTHSQAEEQIEAKQVFHSLLNSDIQAKQLFHSQPETDTEVKQLSHSLPESNIEVKQVFHSTVESDIEAKQLFQGNQEMGSGMSQSVYTLPAKLEVSPHNVSLLASTLLAQGLCNGKRHSAHTAAQLLIHFYNEQPGEYKYLKRLTSYSDGGLAKMLMMLRKKGYLLKSGFQQHAVASIGIKALQKAECK